MAAAATAATAVGKLPTLRSKPLPAEGFFCGRRRVRRRITGPRVVRVSGSDPRANLDLRGRESRVVAGVLGGAVGADELFGDNLPADTVRRRRPAPRAGPPGVAFPWLDRRRRVVSFASVGHHLGGRLTGLGELITDFASIHGFRDLSGCVRGGGRRRSRFVVAVHATTRCRAGNASVSATRMIADTPSP